MVAQQIQDAIREKMIRFGTQVLWDGRPRSNLQIAAEMQRRWPLEFGDCSEDLLAQNVFAYFTYPGTISRMVTHCGDGTYTITDEQKKGDVNETKDVDS